jgi:uncharacterized membrane protein HdeD (DUF308 family)
MSYAKKFLYGIADFLVGMLWGSSIAFGLLAIIWGILYFTGGTFKIFSLSLFWGLMSFITGILYIGIAWWRELK